MNIFFGGLQQCSTVMLVKHFTMNKSILKYAMVRTPISRRQHRQLLNWTVFSSNVVVQKTRMFSINDSGVCLTILLLKEVWEFLMFPKGFDYLPIYREHCVQFKTQMQKAYSVLKSFTHTQKVLIQLWRRYQAIFYQRVLATLFCRHIIKTGLTQLFQDSIHFHPCQPAF